MKINKKCQSATSFSINNHTIDTLSLTHLFSNAISTGRFEGYASHISDAFQYEGYNYVARITAYLNRRAGKYNRKNRTHNLILSNIKSIVQTIPYRSGSIPSLPLVRWCISQSNDIIKVHIIDRLTAFRVWSLSCDHFSMGFVLA